jgi:phenylalanyl-tRNA synthetase alpha chain
MSEQIADVQQAALQAIEHAQTLNELNEVKVQYLGKKGEIQALMSQMRALPKEEKPAFGQMVNDCKETVTEVLEKKQQDLEVQATAAKLEQEKIDVTLPGDTIRLGTTHPLILIQNEIEDLFLGMGYKVAEGPELEQDHYNFELARYFLYRSYDAAAHAYNGHADERIGKSAWPDTDQADLPRQGLPPR